MITDKTIKFLLAVIAANLTILTIKDLQLFPIAHAQYVSSDVQKVTLCEPSGYNCSKR